MNNACDFNVDCLIAPFSKRCYDFCMEKILSRASPEEKRLVLGLEPMVADKLYQLYNSYDINSFADLTLYLTPEEEQQIRQRFVLITQFQLDYFRKERRERDAIIRAIRGLGLDINDSEEGSYPT